VDGAIKRFFFNPGGLKNGKRSKDERQKSCAEGVSSRGDVFDDFLRSTSNRSSWQESDK